VYSTSCVSVRVANDVTQVMTEDKLQFGDIILNEKVVRMFVPAFISYAHHMFYVNLFSSWNFVQCFYIL
jgi:hypothetical protein